MVTEDEIESFDPNEVMAKAYMSKKPEEEAPKALDAQVEQSGPLAFLGLQKRPKEDEEPKAMETDEILEDNVDMAKGDEKIEEKSEDVEEVTETKDKSDQDVSEVTEPENKAEENDEIMEVEDSPKPEEPSAVEENSETEKMDEN